LVSQFARRRPSVWYPRTGMFHISVILKYCTCSVMFRKCVSVFLHFVLAGWNVSAFLIVESGIAKLVQWLDQGWRTCGTRAPNNTWEDFLGTRHSLLSPPFFLNHFFCPTSISRLWRVCTYIHTYLTAYILYMNYRCYQMALQWNFYTQIGAVRSVDRIFIVGAPAWANTWHWTEGFTVFFLNRKQ